MTRPLDMPPVTEAGRVDGRVPLGAGGKRERRDMKDEDKSFTSI